MQPVPVSIISGFLGSGKTSLLNHVLANAKGRKLAALVNDFGVLDRPLVLVCVRLDFVDCVLEACDFSLFATQNPPNRGDTKDKNRGRHAGDSVEFFLVEFLGHAFAGIDEIKTAVGFPRRSQ